jgi:NTE family protein/lysophospholipid hydrolase
MSSMIEVSDSFWTELLAEMAEIRLEKGQFLFRQGDDADSLFFVSEGRLAISVDNGLVLDSVGPGGVIGEMAIILGGQRSATAQAVEDTRLFALDRRRLDLIAEERPDIVRALSTALHARLRRTKLASQLRAVFGEVEPATLRALEERAEWVQLRTGQRLFSEGDPADAAYLVTVGRLRVCVRDNAEENAIDEVGPGEWVGDMALIAGRPRSASVYALRDTELVKISKSVFEELVTRDARVLREVSRVLVERLERQMRHKRPKTSTPRSIAVVPISSEVDPGPLTRSLARVLSRYGQAAHIDARRIGVDLGRADIARTHPSDAADLRVASWLAAQEKTFDFVVYEADRQWSEWNERAMRHADLVVFVARAGQSEALGEAEQRFAKLGDPAFLPRKVLVIQQQNGTGSFPHTQRWLHSRHVDAHFHVRGEHDVERLARILIHRSVGIVFGGGGARGLAHIGVLRALLECGVPIDVVGGASIGAMVAAGAAMELSPDHLIRALPPLLRDAFRDPTLPWTSLMKGRRVLEGARAMAGELQIEDLARPAFIVTTNLTRGQPAVHRKGPIALAIRASSSIPGIFPPVPYDGDLHVDGGVSNNVPIDVLDSLYGGHIIAVDVIPPVDLQATGDFPPALSGFTAIHHRIRNRDEKARIPNMMSVLMRCATAGSMGLRSVEAAAERCDLVLQPPVSRWNVIDFSSPFSIADEGYRATVASIGNWWRANRATVLGKNPSIS